MGQAYSDTFSPEVKTSKDPAPEVGHSTCVESALDNWLRVSHFVVCMWYIPLSVENPDEGHVLKTATLYQ